MDFTPLSKFLTSLTDWVIPGNAAIVYKDGKKVFSFASGYADEENDIKMSTDKLVYLYSVSKVITVTAALQLVEKGIISLDDPLYKFIPEFKNMKIKIGDGFVCAKKHITIHNLFCMAAGFSYDYKNEIIKKAIADTNGLAETVTVAKYIAKMPLMFEPGEGWKYSLCHDVLAAVVSVAVNMPFSEYVKQNIFIPLDMKNSYYHITDDIKKRMAQQYVYYIGTDDIVALQRGDYKNISGTLKTVGKENDMIFGSGYDSGGAGVISNAEDLSLFAAALANGGLGINGNRILMQNTVKLMHTNQLSNEQRTKFSLDHLAGYGYGLGVRTLVDNKVENFYSSECEFGWGGAAGSNVFIDDVNNVALVYVQHMLNPQEEYYQPRIRNALYESLEL